ncbi:hypothetical protein B0H63DRAFT_527520 [Podospora didyma]|uniref:Uncharacterized protein n=1 Tax=Podospora didyma TaxID=330526 RepID=A0AAE0K9N0_9PEZI|nr:hypothetical protein B0H63DRAFT_527520 [Podospora didyma]
MWNLHRAGKNKRSRLKRKNLQPLKAEYSASTALKDMSYSPKLASFAAVGFLLRTYCQDWLQQLRKRTVGLLVQQPGARWHVTTTLPEAPEAPGEKLSKHKRDLQDPCRCIGLARLPLLQDTVTQLVLSTDLNMDSPLLPLKREPDANRLYVDIARHLRFTAQEDPLRVRFPALDCNSKVPTTDMQELIQKQELAAGVDLVNMTNGEKT